MPHQDPVFFLGKHQIFTGSITSIPFPHFYRMSRLSVIIAVGADVYPADASAFQDLVWSVSELDADLVLVFWVFFGWATQHVGSWLPNQGWDPHPLHYKCRAQPLDYQGCPVLTWFSLETSSHRLHGSCQMWFLMK